MKTVYLGNDDHYDVIYDVVTQVRNIENHCGASDTEAPSQLVCDKHCLLSDALFQYKNSPAARTLSKKQISAKFVNDIRAHLSRLNSTHSANDKHINQYQHELADYLTLLTQIQQQLVDIPEWPELRDKCLAHLHALNANRNASIAMIDSFIHSVDKSDASQADKIQKLIEMIIKSLHSLNSRQQGSSTLSDTEQRLTKALTEFLDTDVDIDVAQLKPNNNVVHLKLHDSKHTQAFTKAYGDLQVRVGQ